MMKTVAWNVNRVFPDRVTQYENGSYRWRGKLDKEYERAGYRVTILVCGGISLFLVIMGTVIDVSTLWIFLICAGVVMGLALLICSLLDRAPGSAVQCYEMTDRYVKLESGKYSQYYFFDRIRQVEKHYGYLEVYEGRRHARIYVPVEDYDVVKDYIFMHTGTNFTAR